MRRACPLLCKRISLSRYHIACLKFKRSKYPVITQNKFVVTSEVLHSVGQVIMISKIRRENFGKIGFLLCQDIKAKYPSLLPQRLSIIIEFILYLCF